jgi:tetratricopeptide (TPR) repeat protein
VNAYESKLYSINSELAIPQFAIVSERGFRADTLSFPCPFDSSIPGYSTLNLFSQERKMKQERKTKVHRDTEKASLVAAVNHAADTAVVEAASVVETAAVAKAAAVVEAASVVETAAVAKAAAVVEAASAVETAAVTKAAAVVEAASAVETAAVVEASAVVEADSVLLKRLLEMADGYQATNAPHQAAEMYFELVDCHPDTLEAVQARQGLIEISERYERNGDLRQARSIYERLLKTAP